ncbi:DUF5658 family protein [Methanofollis sp. UBA420]|jgi:hypothetical protein|uniref:DUF5658 family protein n=1 Tax=Methanofollis sp. UBA420 TaxID=1915514 RepID=UPI00316AD328
MSPLFSTRASRILFLLLVLLLAADVATTTYALDNGGQEANPVMAGIVFCPALHALLKASFAVFVLFLCRRADTLVAGSGTYCIGGAAAVYMLSFANNLWQIGLWQVFA